MIFLVQPPALGAYSAGHAQAGVAKPDSSGFAPLPAGDPVDVPLSGYTLRAVWGSGGGLVGRTVRLTGFATPDSHGRWSLTRLHIVCCAADAWVHSVTIEGSAVRPREGTWVQVTGWYVPLPGAPIIDSVPVLRADGVVTVPPPTDPYE